MILITKPSKKIDEGERDTEVEAQRSRPPKQVKQTLENRKKNETKIDTCLKIASPRHPFWLVKAPGTNQKFPFFTLHKKCIDSVLFHPPQWEHQGGKSQGGAWQNSGTCSKVSFPAAMSRKRSSDGDSGSSKRFKNDQPSRVVFLRNLPGMVTDAENMDLFLSLHFSWEQFRVVNQ